MTLLEYLSGDADRFLKDTGKTGERTGWLDLTELKLVGEKLLIVDAAFVPSEGDGLVVSLPAGTYLVQGRAVNYSGEVRVCGLRLLPPDTTPVRGELLGETWTDTAATGLCDLQIFSAAWGNDDDASYERISAALDSGDSAGVVIFDEAKGALMPFVSSGFGDGSYPVFELLAEGKRVGVEVEFIPDGEAYQFGETPHDRHLRIKSLEAQAERGDVEMQRKLGSMYLSGEEVDKNPMIAAKWFARAAEGGDAGASNQLGHLYLNGRGVPQDFGKAKACYEAAVKLGLVDALNNLGTIYSNGRGVGVNHTQANTLFRQGADRGDKYAQYNLGLAYDKGRGVEPDLVEAVKWYRLAADQGLPLALCNLGFCYRHGKGVAKDDQEAFRLFKLGAEQNHPLSLNNLADCYETGEGVAKSLGKAAWYYRLAADKGVTLAQKSLGSLKRRGEGGVTKDLEAAEHWLKTAAENGNAEACFELAELYESGEGPTADQVAIGKLYRQASAKGFAPATEAWERLRTTLTEADLKRLEN